MHERLKKLRKSLDLTQQELADRIGMKRNTIANYESKRNEPSTAVISLICREFNVNEDWLRNGTGGEGNMFQPKSREDEIARTVKNLLNGENDTFKHRFINMLSRLSSSDWERLESEARRLLEPEKETAAPDTDTNNSEEFSVEQEADAFAALARKQFLAEKKAELQALSVKESGADTTDPEEKENINRASNQ